MWKILSSYCFGILATPNIRHKHFVPVNGYTNKFSWTIYAFIICICIFVCTCVAIRNANRNGHTRRSVGSSGVRPIGRGDNPPGLRVQLSILVWIGVLPIRRDGIDFVANVLLGFTRDTNYSSVATTCWKRVAVLADIENAFSIFVLINDWDHNDLLRMRWQVQRAIISATSNMMRCTSCHTRCPGPTIGSPALSVKRSVLPVTGFRFG